MVFETRGASGGLPYARVLRKIPGSSQPQSASHNAAPSASYLCNSQEVGGNSRLIVRPVTWRNGNLSEFPLNIPVRRCLPAASG